MDNLDLNKKLISIMECCNEPVARFGSEEGCEEEHNHASYTQTKSIGDKNITLSANAENMEGIQEIIRLAGLDKNSSVDVDISIFPDGGSGTALGVMPCHGVDLSDIGPSTDDSNDFDYAADDDEYDPTFDYKDEEPKKNSPSDYLLQKTDEQVRESIKKKLDIAWANYNK